MGHFARTLAAVAILAVGTVPLAAFDGPTQTTSPKKKTPAADKPGAAAQEAPDAKDEKQKVAALAQRALEQGIKEYGAGKAADAVKTLETALHGGLAGQQMARALYYRGLANRKLGKPGLAISDLTSAVWLKDGLVGPEREDALKNRAAAYQEAGISNVPDVPAPTYAADSSSATGWETAMNGKPVAPNVAPPAAIAPAPAAVASAPAAVASAPAAVAPAPAAVAWAPTPPPGASNYAQGSDAAAPPQGPTRAPGSSLAATNTAKGLPTQPQSSGGIGGFFSSLFGSSSSSSPNANDGAVTTASITPPTPQPAVPPSAQGWGQTTQVASAPPGPDVGSSFVTRVSETPARAEKADKKVASREPSGKFRLQVAAVRSRSEADALAAKLIADHGGELGARQPEVSEAVLGNMGTFYRVRVGPYADAKEPQQLCGGLRSSGFDCLVVTQ